MKQEVQLVSSKPQFSEKAHSIVKMETTVLEEMQVEVIAMLNPLSREKLLSVCEFLKIAEQENIPSKSRMSLISHILKHLEEGMAELEDGGMSVLLSLRDKIIEVNTATENDTVGPSEVTEKDRLQRELDELKSAIKQKLSEIQQLEEVNTKLSSAQSQLQIAAHPQQLVNTQHPSPPWRKDFKISGQIGDPGQKEKLTFSSLAHQIEIGLSRDYPECEIVDAVIRAISPGLQLRSYLEGKPNLTLPTLRRILRSHFQEKSATELYKQLTSECQGNKETPQNFLMRVLDLRQKILFASQEAESGLKYDPALVQSMFLHTVLTGLQSDSIKVDMQPLLLDTKTTDEALLEKLNSACANEAERQKKKRINVQHTTTVVHAVTSSGEVTDKKPSVTQSVPKSSPDVLTELKELRTDVDSLKTLNAEIAHIRESLQQPACVSPQFPILSDRESVQCQVQPYWVSPGANQTRANTQFQPQYMPRQYYSPTPRVQARKCFNCQQQRTEDRCMHCFRCGSGEHFQAGCRIRGIKPSRENPLNGDGLLPRDRE